jgi:hypothetical protein
MLHPLFRTVRNPTSLSLRPPILTLKEKGQEASLLSAGFLQVVRAGVLLQACLL